MFSSLKKFAKEDKIFRENQFNFYKVIHRDTGELYTARVSSKPTFEYFKNEILGLNDEIHIIPFLNHPSIIKYVMFSSKDFENEFLPTLITEYASRGPLSKIIYQEKAAINPTQKLIIIYGVASGMTYLHSHNILHNDIKVENIWVDDRLFPKISGFTVSKKIDPNNIKNKLMIKGTPAYLAPEVYLDKGQNKSSDVYSFSLFVYELLTGEKPFEDFKDIKKFQEEITQNFLRPKLNEKVPESYRSLIEKCWSHQESDRPTFKEIVNELENNSGFLTENIDEEEYRNYIKFIKDSPNTYDCNQEIQNINITIKADLKEFDILSEFKGIYERETNNLSFFLKRLEDHKFVRSGSKPLCRDLSPKYLLIDTKTNISYCVQKFQFSEERMYLRILREYFSIDNCKCIYKIRGFYLQNKKICLVEDYYHNGSLNNLIDELNKKKARLTETQKLIIIYGIAYGMAYLHSYNILHRNLNTYNIFLDDNFFPIISDLECSNQSFEEIKFPLNEQTIKQTTPFIMAPEFFEDYEKYNRTKPIDVYSFAMVLYEIITCEEPFKCLSKFQILYVLINQERPQFKKKIPYCYKNLIEQCWSHEPEKRPTFDEIVNILERDSQFITKDVDETKYRKYIKYVKEEESVSFDLEDKIFIDIKEEEEEEEEEEKEKEETYKLSIITDPINLDKFQKLSKIGKGSFGIVYKVKNIENEEIQACKISIKSIYECNNELLRSIERELNIISELKFPSILRFIGYNLNDFDNQSRPTIITEFTTNLSLDKIIKLKRSGKSKGEWNDTKKLINIYGIAAGMSYVHSLDIIHRDLKPGNIFIDKYLFPKIGDFGLSKKIMNESTQNSPYDKGTFSYMSPEMFKNHQYTKAGDVYAFALIVYEIMTNNVLYKGLNTYQIMKFVNEGNRLEIPSFVPKCYKELIENCWNEDPNQRYTFDEIVERLKTCPDFITDTVDQVEFGKYVEFIDESLSSKESNDETPKSLSETFKEIYIDLSVLDEPDEEDLMLKNDFIDLSQYERCELINKDNTWKLYTIKNKQTDQIYSAKISTEKSDKFNRRELINLSREINHLSQINHPLILKFIGFSETNFSNKRYPVVVTEHSSKGAMSELLKHVKTIKEWDDTIKLINIYGIALGMRFLHSHNIIHRDLTPESIFYDDNLYPKIGNFGLSTNLHTQESMTLQSTIGLKGNPVFSSPEVLQTNQYTKQSDVYSYGLLVYVIMTNEIPFKNIKGFSDLINEIVTKSNRPDFKGDIDNSYRQLIELCWSQNPEDRPTFQDIVYILETDKRFITSKVNKDKYYEYIKYIDNSYIAFKTNKKIIKKDDLIKTKNQNEVIPSELTDSDSESEIEELNENTSKNEKDEEQNEVTNIIIESKEQNENENNNEEQNKNIIIETEKQDDNINDHKQIFIDENKKTDKNYDTIAFINDQHIGENNNNNEQRKVLDSYEEFIQECVESNQIKKLIEFMNEHFDNETTSMLFDKYYQSSPDIFINLCKEGILQNNIVSHHKYGIFLISKGNKKESKTEKLIEFNQAREHLKKSIQLGFNKSYFTLSLLEHKIYHKDNTAFKYAKEGSEKGDKYSECLLGYFILRGIGIKKDRNAGIKKMIESGAEDFYEQFSTEIGLFYSDKLNENRQQAFKWFERAYQRNKTKATINNYGICYLIGFGVSKNIEKAIDIFEEGSMNGDSNSKYHLSFLLEKTNPEKSFNYLKEAAYEGHLLSQQKYAYKMYEINQEESFKFYKYAADKGQRESQYSVGKMKEENNENQSIEYYQKSSEQGDKNSCVVLAKKYSERNDSENIYKYMRKCITEGQSIVVLEYAINLYKKQYYKEAMNYFNLLSDEINHPIASYVIGVMKYFGKGCERNEEESHKIMKKLSEKGIDQATEFIENHF